MAALPLALMMVPTIAQMGVQTIASLAVPAEGHYPAAYLRCLAMPYLRALSERENLQKIGKVEN